MNKMQLDSNRKYFMNLPNSQKHEYLLKLLDIFTDPPVIKDFIEIKEKLIKYPHINDDILLRIYNLVINKFNIFVNASRLHKELNIRIDKIKTIESINNTEFSMQHLELLEIEKLLKKYE